MDKATTATIQKTTWTKSSKDSRNMVRLWFRFKVGIRTWGCVPFLDRHSIRHVSERPKNELELDFPIFFAK
jgi:hypothetical protein